MERLRIGGLLLAVLFPPALTAQSAQTAPPPAPTKPLAFTVADVHPSPFRFGANYFHIAPPAGDRFVAYHATPLDLITTAYKVEDDAVTGGPPGLTFDRYDIVARLPPGSTQPDTSRMLQSLLIDRFKLVIATETKPLP